MKKREIDITEHSWTDAAGLIAAFAGSPQYTPFAGPKWFEFLSHYVRGRIYVLTAGRNWYIAGYVPVWETQRRFIGKVAEIPPITPYWGPVVHRNQYDSEKAPARVNKVCSALASAVAEKYKRVRMSLHPSIIDVRPFAWSGWSASPRYTTIISFDDPDAYLASLSGKVRNKIKQCEGVEFVSSADPGPFVAMYADTFRRRRTTPPMDAAGVSALPDVFGESSNFYYVLGESGEPIAGRFVIRGSGVAYDLLAAAGERGRGPIGAYLLWRELRDLTAAGYKVDMVGVNVPE
ncbi:MAG: GNAT family N-acetyltransferase, partial [Candidatus Coatesbacteria bacterium]